MKTAKKTAPPPAPAVRQVRAVVVCRPPIAHDLHRLGGDAAAAAGALPEVDILPAEDAPPDGPDADLLRCIAVGKERDHAVRLPVYGYRGGGDAAALCEREVAPLLARLLAGESSALIAYGQTGSGKSYTMGTEQYAQGQAPAPHSVGGFCARRVFELARERGVRDLEVVVAVVEIYREGKDKERLFDLQTPERRRIESFESQVSWLRVATPQELQRKLVEAASLRNTDRTQGNARSSRSHAIFVTQVQFKRQQEEGGGVQRIKARLMLVDLAGSERASLAAANSTSLKQGSGINVGLLYLGMILKELSERGATLNYRLSVLTEILKPALGGGANELTSACNTLVVGCISPLAVHAANTRSTLEFLEQAGTVKNLVRPDVQMMRQQELEAQVEYLQKKVQQLELERQQRTATGAAAAAAGAAGSPGSVDHGTQCGASPLPEVVGGTEEEEQQPGGAGGGADVEADGAAAAVTAAALAAAEERGAALERELAAVRREVVEQRDRAEAYAAQLRQQAAQAAADAAGAVQAALPAPAPAVAAAEAPAAMDAAIQLGLSPAGATPAATGRPSAAAFLAAASPLLAASRGVADWKADVAAAEEATPAGQRLSLLRLLPGAEEIVCERDSHMSPDELATLKDKVERTLEAAQDGDDRAQARAFAEACLYALGAYNKCLGDAITRAEDVEEDAAAERRQAAAEFDQVFEEKSTYMRRASAAEVGLSQYEQQVEDLQRQLGTAQEVLRQAQQQTTPNRPSWGAIRQLITGSGGGASPAPARSAGTPDSRRTSHSDSPAASPRASLSGAAPGVQQQLFGSPSRLGQLPRRDSGGVGVASTAALEPPAGAGAAVAAAAVAPGPSPAAPAAAEERRMTVACLLVSSERQGETAAAAALLAAVTSKRRGAADALAKLSPSPLQQAEAEQAAQQQDAQQAQHDGLIKAVLAPGLLPQPGTGSGPGGSTAAQPQGMQQTVAQPAKEAQIFATRLLQVAPLQQEEEACPNIEAAAKAAAKAAAFAGSVAVVGAHAAEPEQQEHQSMEEDVETPLESPEVSCLLGGGSTSCSTEPAAPPVAAALPAEASAVGAAPHSSQVLPAEGGCSPMQLAGDGMAPPAALPQQEADDKQQLAVGLPTKAHTAEAANAAAAGARMDWNQADAQQQPAVPPPWEQQQQQQQREAPALPGPAISVEVPVGRRRGRGRAPVQELDYCPGSGTFAEPESGEPADPLASLALPAGEPWQRRVLLKGSAVTLEQWQARRMLRRGRCHFCCRKAPDRGCRHPEGAFGEVQLCASCHGQLEPDTWRTGETWVSDDPEDPGYNWCLMCGGAGVGGTDRLVMCTVCRVQGFCSGCIWRFTQDDVAAAQHGAKWECMLCRPPPKLHLAHLEGEDQAGSSSTCSAPQSSASGGSDGCEADAELAAALAAGLRRSTRQRRPAQPQQQRHAAGSDSDSSIIVLLTDSEAEAMTEAESEDEARPARAGSRTRSQPPVSVRRRPVGGAARQASGAPPRYPCTAAADAEEAPAAEPAGPSSDGPAAPPPAGERQQGAAQHAGQAGRKRHRRLLPQRDIQSPTVDEEAQHMRRMQQQRQQRLQQLGAGRSQLQALQQSQRQSQEERLRMMRL